MNLAKITVAAALCLTVTSLACGGAPKTAEPPASTAVAAGEFGVPECDTYMAKYKACLESKVPADARPMMKQGFDQTAAAWRQVAATPQGKSGLAAACVQAQTMAKQTMAPYGCTF
jgi:hypothetical protein